MIKKTVSFIVIISVLWAVKFAFNEIILSVKCNYDKAAEDLNKALDYLPHTKTVFKITKIKDETW